VKDLSGREPDRHIGTAHAGPVAFTAATDRTRVLGMAMIAGGVLFLLRWLGLGDRIVWPVLLVGAGAVVAWQTDHVEVVLSGTERRLAIARVAGGMLLVGSGLAAVVSVSFSAARDGIFATMVVLAGAGLIFGPWIWSLANELTAERQARIRADERSQVAAHLHDSVLQTLALIQRQSSEPGTVALARRQERELRGWLYDGPIGVEATDLRSAIRDAAAEIEDMHRVRVEIVVVGELELDEAGTALVAATREAMVNAAKWSQADEIAVYVEIEPALISVFVRDRGVGFVPADIGMDRQGIANSILDRLDRVGGRAEVTSEVGEGTEVRLFLPRVVNSNTNGE